MNQEKKIRIGGGQGFWGDWLEAPLQLAEHGRIDYLVLDYLAEVTMSILAKQKDRDPALGYAKDFPRLIQNLAPYLARKKFKIVANSGGLNPEACARKCLELLCADKDSAGAIPKIAIVQGDDIFSIRDSLFSSGVSFTHLESGVPITSIASHLRSMNVYIGGSSISQALAAGADIVITGRVADPCLVSGILAHEFSWEYTDWNRLASGVIAGHVIECGAHASGGNFSAGWNTVKEPWNIGFPVVECASDGSFIVTKADNTGGTVSSLSVSEQLLYEIADPEAYYTPDVIADFTSIYLKDIGENQVYVSPAKGKARPDTLKVSASYFDGYVTEGSLVLTGPHVLDKAALCEEILRKRITASGITFKDLHFEYLGAFSCIPGMREKKLYPEPGEIVFRAAIHTAEKKEAERFSREITPLVLSGPSGVTGYASGKQSVREVYAYFPTLLDRSLIQSTWEFVS
jgi:hypothetical protein